LLCPELHETTLFAITLENDETTITTRLAEVYILNLLVTVLPDSLSNQFRFAEFVRKK
jgi:hypothetical protein